MDGRSKSVGLCRIGNRVCVLFADHLLCARHPPFCNVPLLNTRVICLLGGSLRSDPDRATYFFITLVAAPSVLQRAKGHPAVPSASGIDCPGIFLPGSSDC